MIQKQTAKLNIAAAIVKPTWSCMEASSYSLEAKFARSELQ
jgi:hypothetical protein